MAFIDPGALAALSPASLDDAELMAVQRSLGSALRELESAAALVAAEIGRRSSRERGYSGLAQRLGARTPERLVQELTGSSLPEARRLVRVGTLVESAAIDEPWMASGRCRRGRRPPTHRRARTPCAQPVPRR